MWIKKIINLYNKEVHPTEQKILDEAKRKSEERIVVIRDKKKKETENILFWLS